MKKHLMLLLIVIAAVCLFSNPAVKAVTGLEDKEIVAENQYLILYMNKEDTSIAVQCKQTGRVWLSNPVDRNPAQPMQNSQIAIVHDPSGVTKDNFTYSNSFERFEITPVENGVRVDYQFVEKWTAGDYLPQMISADRFEELVLSKLSDRDRDTLVSNYYLVMLRERREDEELIEIEWLEELYENIFGDYVLDLLEEDYMEMQQEVEELRSELRELETLISESGGNDQALLSQKEKLEKEIDNLKQYMLWDLEDVIQHLLSTVIIGNRADITRMEEITFDDVKQMIDNPTYVRKTIPRFSLNKLSELVESTGYSPIEATEDHIANNINPSVPNLEIFEVAIQYQLQDDSFVVTLPVDDFKYPIEVTDFAGEKHTFPILFVEILPFFSAAGLDDEGYILVPDGSGALIHLNNGKIWTSTYNQAVYGRDYAEDQPHISTAYPQQIHLPIFGLKKGDQAYLGIIERGDTIAHLRADISGKRDNYNRIFPRFNIVKSGTIYLEHGGSLNIYQPEMFKGDIVVRYLFFVGEDANYSGMARRYQKYLVENNKLRLNQAENQEPPVLIDLIGAFPRVEVQMGMPRTVPYPATTFADVKNIFDDLRNAGVDNIHIRYSGWLRGGLEHYFPRKVDIEKSLGTEQEFKDLISYIQDNQGVIYPDVGFLNLFQTRWFDGFSPTKHSSRRLNRLPAEILGYNIARFDFDVRKAGYVVSPRVLESLVPKFIDDFSRLGSSNISLSQWGWQLNSDFNRGKGLMIDRQQAAEISDNLLDYINQKYQILVEKANAYTFPYVSTIVNVPIEDSGFDLVDERIPFYQMVVSGFLDYAGDPLNQVSDRKSYLLKSLEAGALPYFTLAAAESHVIKGTNYDHFLSINYDQWREVILGLYEEYYPIYSKIYGHKFIEHQQVQKGVTKSTFDNGISIIVNHNHYPVEYEGVTIDAQGYLLEEDR